MPCKRHRTEDDNKVISWLEQAEKHGESVGANSVKQTARSEARKEFESKPCKHINTKDFQGRQLIKVSTGYTYYWTGDAPLRVGESVILPGSEYRPGFWEDVVTSLGSDYVGPTKQVVRKA